MMQVNLEYGFGEKWFSKNGISVIGFAFDEKGFLLKDDTFVSLFENVNNQESFEKELKSLNGNFALVLQKPESLFFAVDRLRTYPLLYLPGEKSIFVTDNTKDERIKNLDFYENAASSLVDFWCVLNQATLKKGLFQLQAGEYGVFENGELKINNYYKHYELEKFQTADEVFENLNLVQSQYFNKWYQILKDKEVWIPLSGGFDSRYLLAILMQYGHSNIHAYTYGKKGGFEEKIAAQVAKQAGVDWHFVEYNSTVFSTFFSDSWKEYSGKNHHYTSLPHEQDFFALNQLKDKIVPGSYILPGFCGDFLAGSQLLSKSGNRNDVLNKIYNSFGITLDKKNQSIDIEINININDAYQQWFLQQKISKFIINSVRVYEHFGYQFLLPLWDIDWVKFWCKVPFELRENQFLYREFTWKNIFTPLKLNIGTFEKSKSGKTKEIIKSILPKEFLDTLSVRNRKNDINNLNMLYELIYNELGNKSISKDYEINRIHAQYMIKMLRLADL